jgi:hypothetical protein
MMTTPVKSIRLLLQTLPLLIEAIDDEIIEGAGSICMKMDYFVEISLKIK